MDKLRGMMGDHGEKAAQMADTAKEKATDAGQQAAEHMPAPAADAMGNLTGKGAQDGEEQLQQAETDMESEGGHEWER
ncbi:hypothetical protein ACFW1A_18225 [Kitasatospora sp. NPDC058965]|uniref:hypothetical protein n=1 Tax=Kitasatospora sp. NPDC058965 TaxID=3346682 RepID=UPI0036AD3BF3